MEWNVHEYQKKKWTVSLSDKNTFDADVVVVVVIVVDADANREKDILLKCIMIPL